MRYQGPIMYITGFVPWSDHCHPAVDLSHLATHEPNPGPAAASRSITTDIQHLSKMGT